MTLRFRWRIVFLTCAVLFGQPVVWAEGPWPQWQGPQRDAMSTETGLLQDFPEEGPPRLWLFEDCGIGYAGPAIVGNKLYIMGALDGIDHLLCLDATSGEPLWKSPLGATLENDWGNGPRGTPTVDGEQIYLITPQGTLVCLQKTDGSILWSRNLQDLGGSIPTWGYSESPLVMGDRVFCTPGGDQGAIAAFDKMTGKTLWQASELKDTAHYASIMPMHLDGQTSLVQLLHKQVVGVDPADGKLLWSVPWDGNVAVIPTPIVSGDSVYVSSGYGAGCAKIKLLQNEPEIVFQNKDMTNHHGGVLLLEDRLYGHSDGKGWICQDFATGETLWRERSALGKGAIAYADNRFYCMSEDEGEVVLIAASPDGWQEHGRFTLDPQTELRKPRGKIWTHPVIADGKLYLRDQNLLFCFNVKTP